MSRRKADSRGVRRGSPPSRGVVEKAARDNPVWRWPDVAEALARDHCGTAGECLDALLTFRPWITTPDGGCARWSVGDAARRCGVPPAEMLQIYAAHRWAGDLEWDAERKRHRPPRQWRCLPSGQIWGAPRMQDEELVDALARLAVALDDLQDCLAHHDGRDGVLLQLSPVTRALVATLAEQAQRCGIEWEDTLADFAATYGPILAQ
ncbi:MAG: hypothetical protein WAW85_09665 [Gordonia sp. (in: high G+C Gram-positive bacteria)]|uniref:hypothetical protein n=1 Tax=Gordonia sp. (in: high G+C Gram-positive bacteria) TaxID=84139 RepID=UPI003BB7CA12